MPCGWEAPDGSRAVILDGSVVEGVRARAIEAFLSLPRRGAEIGGLLLGHVDAADPTLAWVESFEEIPCEHRYGPSYVLSEPDRGRLRQALSRQPGAPVVVGLYRSYTGREPALDAADEDLIRTYLRDRHYAYLLLKPRSSEECEAAFVFWENGELPPEPRYPRFAFDASRMPAPAMAEPRKAVAESAADALPAVEPEPQPKPEPEPVPAPAFTMPEPRRRINYDEEREPPPPRRRIWLPLLAIVVVSIAAALAYEIWRIGNQTQWTDLPLDARAAAGQVELTWDRTAPAVTAASRGVLSVTDGPVRQDIRLGPAEIRAGSYPYRPAHRDVLFRLELYHGGVQSSGGALRMMNLASAAAEPVPRAAAPTPTPPAPRPTRTGIAERESAAAVAVPPTVLHEVHPGIPAGIRSRIHGRVVVPVQVQVAGSGKVTRATADGGGDATYRYLARYAARAAYSWRFRAARSRSGRPVAASKTIYFVFTRP